MKKKAAIQLLYNEGWTKADAQRALEAFDFNSNRDIEEMTVRRLASQFAGSELSKRQNLQRAQKGLVTKRNKQIAEYIDLITKWQQQSHNSDSDIEAKIQKLSQENQEITQVNDLLKKDNRDLKNIVDAIKLKYTIETKHILELNNINEIKKGLVKLLKSALG